MYDDAAAAAAANDEELSADYIALRVAHVSGVFCLFRIGLFAQGFDNTIQT